jgi:hypothetical protein
MPNFFSLRGIGFRRVEESEESDKHQVTLFEHNFHILPCVVREGSKELGGNGNDTQSLSIQGLGSECELRMPSSRLSGGKGARSRETLFVGRSLAARRRRIVNGKIVLSSFFRDHQTLPPRLLIRTRIRKYDSKSNGISNTFAHSCGSTISDSPPLFEEAARIAVSKKLRVPIWKCALRYANSSGMWETTPAPSTPA